MTITSTPTDPTIDTLPHIQGDIVPSVSRPDTLRGRAASLSGCIDFLSSVQVCYNVGDNEIDITVKLVGITLGEARLTPTNPKVTLGGGTFGLKAEVTLTFDFSTSVLHISGQACAPFVGCTSGDTSVQL
jgi:hypothetical protein